MKPYIFPSSIETARALILHLVKLMLDEPDRTFCIAFSGGSTPALMFDLWANEYTDITPWERLKVFWVDERCVPVSYTHLTLPTTSRGQRQMCIRDR